MRFLYYKKSKEQKDYEVFYLPPLDFVSIDFANGEIVYRVVGTQEYARLDIHSEGIFYWVQQE